MLIFVAIFAVCWLPRHVYLLSWHYGDITFNAYWHVFKATGFCLTFVNSAVNPFALYLINDQFRLYFNHYLCGRCDGDCFSRHYTVTDVGHKIVAVMQVYDS